MSLRISELAMGKIDDIDFEGFETDLDDLLDDSDYIYSLIDNVEWDSQLRAISLVISRNKKAREDFSAYINQNEEDLKAYNGPYHDHYVDEHIDLLHETVYRDAAESMAAIGMIAPMVESVLCQSLAALGRMYHEKKMSPPAHKRWTRADKANCTWEVRWNCQIKITNNYEVRHNIFDGFPQLAEACGLDRYLSADFMAWFKAMFNYRNYMFDGGFEWSVGNRQKFAKMIEREGWQRFFNCSTSGEMPWIYYLTDETINDMPDRVGKMLDELGQFAKNLPFDLIAMKQVT
jgi:hypothetical protein